MSTLSATLFFGHAKICRQTAVTTFWTVILKKKRNGLISTIRSHASSMTKFMKKTDISFWPAWIMAPSCGCSMSRVHVLRGPNPVKTGHGGPTQTATNHVTKIHADSTMPIYVSRKIAHLPGIIQQSSPIWKATISSSVIIRSARIPDMNRILRLFMIFSKAGMEVRSIPLNLMSMPSSTTSQKPAAFGTTRFS